MDTWSSGGSRRPPADKELEAVSTLLTLFDLQEELAAEAASTQDDQSALASMQTLLTKVINDSCDYVRNQFLVPITMIL